MKKIARGYILPSGALVLKGKTPKLYRYHDKPPETGDVIYGEISRIGQHSQLENVSGRIHVAHNGTRAVFVFGNRYAPDYYEGVVPDRMQREVDLLARSGIVGTVRTKNALVKDPTRVRVLGYACDADGSVINTRQHPLIVPKTSDKKDPRARLVLVVGTSMNSGKSLAAVACCWALTMRGYSVRASKVTGTASLQDILHMNDAGAHPYVDFTYFGYPSTYLLPEDDVIRIFDHIDLKYANSPRNYWVAELSDGIGQRETALLLRAPHVRRRIHRLILCASDAFGAIGGLHVLKEQFDLEPHAISGICSSSPLHIRELADYTAIPVFNSANPDPDQLASILLA